MLAIRFRQCVEQLQKKSATELTLQQQLLNSQKSTMAIEISSMSGNLRQLSANGTRTNSALTARINTVKNGVLKDYQLNLKLQQQQHISSEANLRTIARITEQNTVIDQLQSSIDANNTKISAKAQSLTRLMNEATALNDRIAFITDCITVDTYLQSIHLPAESVADYEINRLYDRFTKEVP